MQLPMIEQVRLRCSIELKDKLEQAARAEGKSLADFARQALSDRVASAKSRQVVI